MNRPAFTPAQERMLENFEAALKDFRRKTLAEAPEHIRRLGKILRRSVESGSLLSLKRFLDRHLDEVPRPLEAFRDYLIINRIDLKDLEPEARHRLRKRTLATQDRTLATTDYRQAAVQARKRGEQVYCRDCRWFVTAPRDGNERAELSCVQLGTKGADVACVGFTAKPS